MEVVPLAVGVASRSWDEQHLDLAAASGQIGGASTAGFTGNVSGTAARFTSHWERSTSILGTSCEARADGLRTAIRGYVASDEASAMHLTLLLAFLEEQR